MGSERDQLKKAFRATEACLDLDGIASFVLGGGDARSLQKAKAHVESCPRCSTEVALYRDFLERPPSAAEAADVEWIARELQERRPNLAVSAQDAVNHFARPPISETGMEKLRRLVTGWHLPALAVAAVALLAIGIVSIYRTAPEFAVPDLQPARDVRSGGIEVLFPSGDLESAPTELSWKAVRGADRYRVRLLEIDGHEFFRAEVRRTSVLLPHVDPPMIVPGKKLLWQVTALDSAGNILQSSPEVAFRVKPPAAR